VIFTVRWKGSARNDLASDWLRADSATRRAITAASHSIDQRLRANPENQGESRPLGRRILFVPPLGITFKVDHSSLTVWVLRVWLIGTRGP
jgi:hypothetical protein